MTAQGRLGVDRDRSRDPKAADFGYLFETHHKELFRLALLLPGGDRFLAEEAVSHAFVATLPKWRKGEVLEAVPYLRRAVTNQVNGTFRRRRLERREVRRRNERGAADESGRERGR